MYKHQLMTLIGLQKQSKALRSFFASQRSYGYALAQEKHRSILRIVFSPSMEVMS